MDRFPGNEKPKDSLTSLERGFKVLKEGVFLIGFVVTGTLLYSNITNSIETLKDADRQRKEDIKQLQQAQQITTDTLNKKLDDIASKQSDQLLQITKLAAQLDYRTGGSLPQQFQRRN